MIELTGPHYRLLIGDSRQTLRTLPAGSVHAVVTSPPYWALRSYATGDAKHLELGSEPTIEEYIANQMAVFDEVRRVLRDDGLAWINLGDTAAADGNQHLVPHRFAMAMQARGWILRSTVVWRKASPMPESLSGTKWVRCRVKVAKQPAADRRAEHGEGNGRFHDVKPDNLAKYEPCPGCPKCSSNGGWVLRRGAWRCTTSHEYIFQFAKSMDYFADGEAAKAVFPAGHTVLKGTKTQAAGIGANGSGNDKPGTRIELSGLRNPRTVWPDDSHHDLAAWLAAQHPDIAAEYARAVGMADVWSISTEPLKEKHFAAFPGQLVYNALRPSISQGGCCAACGAQFAPMVVSERVPTRPGKGSKVNGLTGGGYAPPGQSPHSNARSEMETGNRDPNRHVTTTHVEGYRPTCECNAASSRPIVLDPYAGSGTTGRVALSLGCDFVGCELSEEYAAMAVRRLARKWRPKHERNERNGKTPETVDSRQKELFA